MSAQRDLGAEAFALRCIAVARPRSAAVAAARTRVKRKLRRAGVPVAAEATYRDLVVLSALARR